MGFLPKTMRQALLGMHGSAYWKDVCRIWREKTIYDSYCSYLCINWLLVRVLLKVLYRRHEIPRYHRTRTLKIPTTINIMTMDNNNHLHLTRAARPCLSDLVSWCPIGTVLGSDCSPSPCRIDYSYLIARQRDSGEIAPTRGPTYIG